MALIRALSGSSGGGDKSCVGNITSLGSSWTDVVWDSSLTFTPKRLIGYHQISWSGCPIMGFDYDVDNAHFLEANNSGFDIPVNGRIGSFVKVNGTSVQFKSIDSSWTGMPLRVIALG